MDRYKILEHLVAAKRAHITWVNRAKSMIDGPAIVRGVMPLKCTECQFGLWFYKEGERFFNEFEMHADSRVENLHNNLHEEYLKIYNIYFDTTENLAFDKSAKMQKKVITQEEKEIVTIYFNKLRSLSYEMIAEIQRLENYISTKQSA